MVILITEHIDNLTMDKSDLSARILEFGETILIAVIRYDLDTESSACDFTVLVVDFILISIDSGAFNTCFNSNEQNFVTILIDQFFERFEIKNKCDLRKTKLIKQTLSSAAEHANSKNLNDLFYGGFDLVSNIAYIKTSGLYRIDVVSVPGEIGIKNHLFDSQERTLLLNYALLIDVTQLLLGIECIGAIKGKFNRKTNDTIVLRIKTLTKCANNQEMVYNDSNMTNIVLLTENKECFRMNLYDTCDSVPFSFSLMFVYLIVFYQQNCLFCTTLLY